MIYNKEMKELLDKLNNIDMLNINIDLVPFENILFPQFIELTNVYNEMCYLIGNTSIINETGEELSWS